MAKVTYKKIVEEKLSGMEIGDKFDIENFVETNWGTYNFFVRRSFDVYLCKAKAEYPVRKFETQKGHLVRLK
jgi:hypothetical protein